MEQKVQELADMITSKLLTMKFGDRFTNTDDITEDKDMNEEWECINGGVYEALTKTIEGFFAN